MKYKHFKLKTFYIGRLEFAKGEKCLFFKNDSCLSDCLSVFTQKLPDNSKLKVKLFIKGEEASE